MSKNVFTITRSITERTYNLEQYFNKIRKYDNLSYDEEKQLAKKIKKGDESAKEKLINCNLRFVVSVAKHYQNQGLPLSDLINEGNIGLIKAAEKFDENKNNKFISFAIWYIRQSIRHALAEKGRLFSIPDNHTVNINKVNEAYIKLEKALNRKPEISEISNETGLSEKIVKLINQITIKNNYLEDNINNSDDGDENSNLFNVIENKDSEKPDDVIENESFKNQLDNFLSNCLKNEHKDIIKKLFGIDNHKHSITEIAQDYDLSEERIRQIKNESIDKLKSSNLKNVINEFI